MNWWQAITGTQSKLPMNTFFKLRANRFHRILENQKRFNDLIADAVEKLSGEYVLDNQYLVGFIDEVFSVASEITCDSNVIRESAGSCKQYHEVDKMKAHLRRILAWQPMAESAELIIPIEEADELDHYHLVGGAFTRQAEMRQRLGLPVPEGFVISIAAFNAFVEYNNLSNLMNAAENMNVRTIRELEQRIRGARVPAELWKQLKAVVARTCDTFGQPLQFTMSGAVFGDEYNLTAGNDFSASGNTGAGHVFNEYRSIVAALYSADAVKSRVESGLAPKCSIAVLVSRKIQPHVGGIIQTVNPENPHRDRMLIQISSKPAPLVLDVSRHAPYEIAKDSDADTVLSRRDTAGLAEKAMRVERYFRGPQEITWARDEKGDVFFIHTAPLMLDPDKIIAPGNLAEAVSNHETLYEKKGKIASSGISYGPVYVAKEDEDIENLPEGCVLVAENLEPRIGLMEALGRAAAILTDRGEPAGHVASLAREFHVPAIVALGDATRRLAPGKVVTVDADDNVVYSGPVEELLNYHLWEYLDVDVAREYRLLRFALHRLTSKNMVGSRLRRTRLKRRKTLEDIVRVSVDQACGSIADSARAAGSRLRKSSLAITNNLGLKLHVLDIGGAVSVSGEGVNATLGEIDAGQISSAPFAAFWNGLAGSGLSRFTAGATGLAVVSSDHLLMNLNSGARTYVIGSYMSGEPERDYIYGRVSDASSSDPRSKRQTLWLQGILAQYRYNTYSINDGFTAWKYNLTAGEMERTLRMLGGMLGYAEDAGEAEDVDTVAVEFERFLKKHGDAARTF